MTPVAIGGIAAGISVFGLALCGLGVVSDAVHVRNSVDLAAISAAQILVSGGGAEAACNTAKLVADGINVVCTVDDMIVTISGSKISRFDWILPELSSSATAGPARE